MSGCQGGSQALDARYRQMRRREMKTEVPGLPSIHESRSIPTPNKKNRGCRRHQGQLKVARGPAHDGALLTQLDWPTAILCKSSAPEVRDILEKGVATTVPFPCGPRIRHYVRASTPSRILMCIHMWTCRSTSPSFALRLHDKDDARPDVGGTEGGSDDRCHQ